MDGSERRLKLLLVDDEREFLDAVAPGLEHRGFAVSCAENGARALQLIEHEAFDVVVLDVKMPGLDGVSVFRRVRTLAPRLPVVMLTGHGTLHQAFETCREGVFDYLLKPCEVDALANVARQAAERGLQGRPDSLSEGLAPLREDAARIAERVYAERPD